VCKYFYIDAKHKDNFVEALNSYFEDLTVVEESDELITVCEDVCESFEMLAFNPHSKNKADSLIRIEFGI
jgi:hypothetical protein